MAKKNKSKKKEFWEKYKPYFKYILWAIPVLIYFNSLFNNFAVDDSIVILDNEFTTQGVKGIPKILSEDTFLGFFKDESKSRIVSGGRYRPLSLVLFAIEYQLVGVSPFLYHLINIILYALLGWLIYLCVPLLFGELISKKHLPLFAFLVSLLFLVHPLHTEAVANIKGRDEIMALLFCLWSYYIIDKEKKSTVLSLAMAGLVFFLGLLSKENAITFLVIIPLIFWQLKSYSLNIIIKKSSPFLFAGIIFLVIRNQIIGNNVGGVSQELMNNPFLKWNGSQYIPFSTSEKLALIANTFFQYIKLFIFPHPLTHDYYPKHIDATSFNNLGSILGLVLALVSASFALLKLKSSRIISFGLIFFGVTLSLVINILFPIGTIMSERFMFMPSLGLAIIFSYLLLVGLKHEKHKKWVSYLFTVVVLFFCTKTFIRNFDWKNNFTLFSKDIEVSKNSAKLNNAIGGEIIANALSEEDAIKRDHELRRAMPYLLKAIEIHPTYKNAYLLLGNNQYHLKNYAEAIDYYRQALQLDPNYADAHNNLAVALRDAGKQAGEVEGNLIKAIQYLKDSEKINNKDFETLRLLGVAYGMGQNHENAIKYFTLALEIRPEDAQALYNLGLAYLNAGQTSQGESFINRAKTINPNIGQNAN